MSYFSLRRTGLVVLGMLSLFMWLLLASPDVVRGHGPTDYAISFYTFVGQGFAPDPLATQLDSDLWRVTGLSEGDLAYGDTATSGDFARGLRTLADPPPTTSGIYAFEVVEGDFALGVQPGSSDFTPGTFELRLQNQSGNTVSHVRIDYNILVRNNADRSSSLNLAYSLDGVDFVPVPSMEFTSPEAADELGWQSELYGTAITGLAIPDGDFFYFQWRSDDVGGSGSRDELALDNIEVTQLAPLAATIALFEATPQPEGVAVSWSTVAEPDCAGFNVWRATAPTAPETQLNPTLIAAQGNGGGAAYAWLDKTAAAGTTYYYWLEDVDLYGGSTFVGPAEATMLDPLAVTLDRIDVSTPSAGWGLGAALGVAAVGAAWQWGRRR